MIDIRKEYSGTTNFKQTSPSQQYRSILVLILLVVGLMFAVIPVAGAGEKTFLYVQDGKEYYENAAGEILTVEIPSTLTFLRYEDRKTYYRTFDGRELVTEEFGGLLAGTTPDYDWWYGCSPTSTGMMMGHYDINGYNGQTYTNLVTGGVAETTSYSTSAPLATATIATSEHISDYWVGYGQSGNDPNPGGHSDNSLADFMETSKDTAGNTDGGTNFTYWLSNSPFTASDVETYSLEYKSGMYGIGQYAQYRGYDYTTLYNQRIYGYGGVSAGFTFDNFKTEIDAGRPVLIHIVGHTMLGVGYTDPSTIYVNDTWTEGPHIMTWGSTYDGRAHNMVSCLTLTGGASASSNWLLWTK